jgi:glycosyltransferase involved in cell wall biosynthesis
MLRGQDIICLSTVPWDYLKIANQQTMRCFARHNRVLFVDRATSVAGLIFEPQRTVEDLRRCGQLVHVENGLYRLTPPLWLPWAARYASVNRANMALVRGVIAAAAGRLNMDAPILYTYQPQAAYLAGKLGERLLIYDVIDQHSAFPHARAGMIWEMERRLLQRADLVFAISPALYRQRHAINSQTRLCPIGAEVDHFLTAADPQVELPQDVRAIGHPIAGYFGGMDGRFDEQLLLEVARRLRRWQFVLIGPCKIDGFPAAAAAAGNVHLLGPRPYGELPRYAAAFDVCIMPYRRTRFTKYIFPNKIFEYLATGRPVVSSPVDALLELAGRRAIVLAETAEQFTAAVVQSQHHRDEASVAARLAIARANTWQARAERISEAILEYCRCFDIRLKPAAPKPPPPPQQPPAPPKTDSTEQTTPRRKEVALA